jgi:transcriptional regulator with XRE-family HTH domain
MAFSDSEDRPRHYVREWRKHRRLTQEKLAESIPFTVGAISQLETGRTSYTQNMLEALAKALGCEPGELLMRDPTASNDFWKVWDSSPRLRDLFTRLASIGNTDAGRTVQMQVIGYAEGALDRYEATRDTDTTPNS